MTTAVTDIVLGPMTEQDGLEVRAIYLEGISTGNATFEQSAPDWEKWDASHLKTCRIVVRQGNDVLGWAALSPVSGRCVYAGVAEVSVYVAERARGRKLGSRLLAALVAASEKEGMWTLQAGNFPHDNSNLPFHQGRGLL